MNYDVVIFGGGTAGCSCAYNCAKNKVKTLLVEKNNFLGGLMTGGLVVPVMKSSVNQINCDYYKKLVETAKRYHAQITYKDGNDGWFNPELMKIVLDDILTSSEVGENLDILFDCDIKDVIVEKKNISGLALSSGILSIPIVSKYFVDCTGNSSLAFKAGCEFLEDSSIKQQNSLRFIVGNVDIEKFCEFIKSIDKDENITNTFRLEINPHDFELHFTTASTWDNDRIWAMDSVLKEGVKDGTLLDSDRSYFQVFSVARSKSQVAFNCPRINNYNNDPYKASKELIKARKAIYRFLNFSKKHFPGFENAVITNIATQTGIREERRVKTKYIYKTQDLTSGKKFDNAVLSANYSIDIHSDKKDGSILQKTSTYELPIESLMSCDIDNLFVAGKNVGAEFGAHSAIRVQKSCMSMGEGVAKFIAKLQAN